MATGGQKRTRSERVAALELPPGSRERILQLLRRREIQSMLGIGLVMAVLFCAVTRGWDPAMGYRSGFAPAMDIVARADFSLPDPAATEAARDLAIRQVRYVYAHNPAALVQLRAQLRNQIVAATKAENLSQTDTKAWAEFQPADVPSDAASNEAASNEAAFQRFRQSFLGEMNPAKLEECLARVFAPFEQRGLLDALPEDARPGNQSEILVYPEDDASEPEVVQVGDVLIGDAAAIRDRLAEEFADADTSQRLFEWVRPRLMPTLVLDAERTQAAREAAVVAVAPVEKPYPAGQVLVNAGESITKEQLVLLHLEHAAAMAQRSWSVRGTRAAATVFLFFTLLVASGVHLAVRAPQALASPRRIWGVAFLSLATVALAVVGNHDSWRAELLPLVLFSMTVAIAYQQSAALLLANVLAVIVVLGTGRGLQEYLILMGVSTTAALQVGRIRTRTKLIHVGLSLGAVAAVLEVVMSLMNNQPVGWPVLYDAASFCLWSILSGFLLAGLLPFLERAFGILTDLSLLELGDVAHPLIQELVRRAPSTYNHSITVASIAEAAAESIGARGPLVRVGAYFHDIGKMLQPEYYIENQGGSSNRHESLNPTMSTLVIIAHVKDGADLARKHNLPESIIDMIEQHHGTTLVEYFYGRAQQMRDPNSDEEIDENTYRYPGPRPQTKEAGVLMLADAAEGASRSLADPTPARMESLVRSLVERRLDDGQFDESGLTLCELRVIERSLVKSLTAIYHGRIKYPESSSKAAALKSR